MFFHTQFFTFIITNLLSFYFIQMDEYQVIQLHCERILRHRFSWLNGGEKRFSCKGGRLTGGKANRKRKVSVERTCEGVIVLTQYEEGRSLRVVGCLYWMSRRLCTESYVYDGTRVNQLKLPGPVPGIEVNIIAVPNFTATIGICI